MNLLTPADVAARLSLDEKALKNMRQRRTGPEFIQINSRCVRYSEQALTDWVASRPHGGDAANSAGR